MSEPIEQIQKVLDGKAWTMSIEKIQKNIEEYAAEANQEGIQTAVFRFTQAVAKKYPEFVRESRGWTRYKEGELSEWFDKTLDRLEKHIKSEHA